MDFRSADPWALGGILLLAGVGLVYAVKNAGADAGGVCVPKIRPGARILLVGDSLSVGLKTPLKQLATTSGCDFLAFAESGTTMQRWIGDAQVSAALQSFAPTLVLVSLGTNDSKGNTPDGTLAIQVGKMRDWLTSGGASLVWIDPPKLPFPERVSALVKAAGIENFPSSTLPIPQPDGIHTSGRGYAGWAEHVWAFLSCTTSSAALSGLGRAPSRPSVPNFMVRARPPQARSGSKRRASKRRRRV